jgi:hypothetical protein
MFARQPLHFGLQFAVKLPEPLGCEGLEGHSKQRGASALWPTFLERTELAGAGIRFHLFQHRNAAATGREIPFDLGVPLRLVALGEPSAQRCLLLGWVVCGHGSDG